MATTVAVIAAGNMGAGVAARLVEAGAEVVTMLKGRSKASVVRAGEAGMRDAGPDEIAAADFVLSIVPPAEAIALAELLATPLSASRTKPIYVDCNAVSPDTTGEVARIVAGTGATFVDGAIIGLPPRRGGKGPKFFFSGIAADRIQPLVDVGLDIRVIDGGIGAASALKMSYAAITKGIVAIASASILAATRAGVADELYRELASSRGEALAGFSRAIPDMLDKAYRWVAEMEEIAEHMGRDDAASIYEGVAAFYAAMAADHAGKQRDERDLLAFFKRED